MVKISPIFVAFLENMNNTLTGFWPILTLPTPDWHLCRNCMKGTEMIAQCFPFNHATFHKIFFSLTLTCFNCNNKWIYLRTTDARWLDPKFSTAHIHIPIPQKNGIKCLKIRLSNARQSLTRDTLCQNLSRYIGLQE